MYTPTLDVLGQSYITPVNAATAAAVDATIVRWADFSMNPIQLAYDELCRMYINALPGSAQVQAAFILFTDGNQPAIPQGRHIQWRGTYVAPSTAGAWSAVNVTWQKELIPGDYAVVGMRVVGATTLAARINSRSNPQWFPGVLVSSGYDTVFPQLSLIHI